MVTFWHNNRRQSKIRFKYFSSVAIYISRKTVDCRYTVEYDILSVHPYL